MNPLMRFGVGILKRTQLPKIERLITNRLFWFEFNSEILKHFQKDIYITDEGIEKLSVKLAAELQKAAFNIIKNTNEEKEENPLAGKLLAVFQRYWK